MLKQNIKILFSIGISLISFKTFANSQSCQPEKRPSLCQEKLTSFGGNVLVIGDSFANDIGLIVGNKAQNFWVTKPNPCKASSDDSLFDDTNTTAIANLITKGKPATGLARPDAFNWPKRMSELIEKNGASVQFKKGDIVVMWFGMNDGQSLTDEAGRLVAKYSSAESENTQYKTEYLNRLLSLDDICKRNQLDCYLMAPPIPSVGNFGVKMKLIRKIEEEFQNRAVATHVLFDYADFSNIYQTADHVHLTEVGYKKAIEILNDRIKQTRGIDLFKLTKQESFCF